MHASLFLIKSSPSGVPQQYLLISDWSELSHMAICNRKGKYFSELEEGKGMTVDWEYRVHHHVNI